MFISFLRTIILYLVVVLTLRVLGKRQVGELEPSELVVAILISDLAAVPMQDIGIPLLSGVIPILTLLALELAASEWSMHSVRFRAFLCGKPVFIIREGVIDQTAMAKNRLTIDELNFCLRQAGILDASLVQYAVLETNGQLTTFLYPQYAPLTPQDAGKKAQNQEFAVNLICNGRILEDNLTFIGKNLGWLDTELARQKVTRDEVFCPDYTRQERENLVTRIRAQVNDKRQYAQVRVVAEMCAGEPFGVDKLGDEASAAAITPQKLWDCYQQVLRTAPIEFYYCGSAPLERVRAAVQAIVDGLPAGERAPLARPEKGNAPAQPRRVEEALDVTQGKLAMGFRTCIDAWDEDYPALMLLNAVYGGTTTSKLFLNVRERLSLCYYASSGLMKYKDVMLVSSGVEFSKVGQAQDEILAQLQACKDGGFTDDELEWARRSVVSTLMTTLDAQSRLEDYWLGQAAAGLTEAPDELAQRVERTTRAQVQAAAQKLALDTVYFLKGKE